MRIHASLKDDARLWISAGVVALALYVVIVVLGVAPLPFGSASVAHGARSPRVVVKTHPAPAAVATPTSSARRRRTVPGRNAVHRRERGLRAAGTTLSGRRRATTPSTGQQPARPAPPEDTPPASRPAGVDTTPPPPPAASSTPAVPPSLPPPPALPDPPVDVPSLPDVNAPSVGDVTGAVPPVALP